MASYSDLRSITATLSGTTADEVTLTQAWPTIVVSNADSSTSIYFRQDGTTAVAEADGTTRVLPVSARIVPSDVDGGQTVVSIVGDGGSYTIEGQNAVPGGNTLQVAQDLADLEANLPASYARVVNHGATAATARPTAELVIWKGSVEPDNMEAGDLWVEVV